MIVPYLFFIVLLGIMLFFAYYSYLVWFNYLAYLEQVRNYQAWLDKIGIHPSAYARQYILTTPYKWLARVVLPFMFVGAFIFLLFLHIVI